MIYETINLLTPRKDCGYYFAYHNYEDGNTFVRIISNYDYCVLCCFIIEKEVYLSLMLLDFIILYDPKGIDYYTIDLKSKKINCSESNLIPQYFWDTGITLYLDKKVNYKCFSSSNDLLFEFTPSQPVGYKWYINGILTYIMNSKENSWISCLDPNGGKEMWRIDFDWKISRLEIYKDLIIVSYHAYERFRTDEGYEGQRNWYNPYKYTIVIDGSSGKEIWRFDEQYEYIDFNNEVVLLKKKHEVIDGKIRSMSVIELDIHTGKELTNVLLSPIKPFGVIPSFVDNEFIYYKVYKGPFGKISKKTGKIVWEFDLIDPYGDKRMVNDWILLGNGKLVLQAPSNQNGTFTCIFDPEENMEFANIIDGVPKD